MAINYANTVELILLAAYVAAVSAEVASRWSKRLAYLLMPLLGLGGAAYVVDGTTATPVLNACLAASLFVMLLVWAAVLAWAVRR